MDINELMDEILRNKRTEKSFLLTCINSNDGSFLDHYSGNVSEQNLFLCCKRAKKSKTVRMILMQIIHYSNECSISARVLAALNNLPKNIHSTCYDVLAHCQLNFIQKYTIFLRYPSFELFIDLLEFMCVHIDFSTEDIRFLMEQGTEIQSSAIQYFVDSFDDSIGKDTKNKLDTIKVLLAERRNA